MTQDLILFTVNASRCALALGCVKETLRPPPVEPLAEAPGFVLGAAIVRGEPVPVVDAGSLLCGVPLDPPGRLIMVEPEEGRRVGLAVTAVLGVHRAASLDLSEAPALLAEADDRIVATMGRIDGALLSVLKLGRVVPDEVWSALEEKST